MKSQSARCPFDSLILPAILGLGFVILNTSCTIKASIEDLGQTGVPSSGLPTGQPVILSVSSSTANGAYKAGDSVTVTITFGLPATVTGSPRVLLETGPTDRYATYVSGSGTDTVNFTYTVLAGDISSDLAYVATNSLELNGGTINAGSTPMTLTLPALAATGALDFNKNIVIDTTAPVLGGAIADGAYFNSITTTPNLSFTGATDTGGSGVAKYQIAIGTTLGGTQTLNWTDAASLSIPYQHTGLTLVEGTTYYPSLRAVDAAGNVSAVIQGDGWIPDVTAPTSPATVYDGVSSYNTAESPTMTWTTSTDAGSGLAKYQLAIGTSAGGTDVLTWTDIGTVTSYNQTGLTLSVGTTYYASIRAVDNAGNTTTAQGDGWQVVACDTYGWCPQAYIKASNAEGNDFFGLPVAVYGDTIAVSANESSSQTTITNGPTASSDNSALAAGAVYVFKRSGTTWIQEAYIKASNAETSDSFGSSLAIYGDTLAVGAVGESSNQTTITNGTASSANNAYPNSGAVYVYKRTGVTWAQEAYIKPPNAHGGDLFGGGLSLHGNTLAVGASMENSDQTTITNGTTASTNQFRSWSGAAYVFKRTGVNWAQEAYIKAPNAGSNDRFGIPIAVDGDTLAVSAIQESSNQTTITNGATASSDNSASVSGAVYVFKRTGVNWAQEAYIKASKITFAFGRAISLNGDTLAVAASDSSGVGGIINGTTSNADTTASNSGAVYVYKRTGITWAQEAYIKASNPQTLDDFGSSVSLVGDTLVVGAGGQDGSQTTVTNGATAPTNSLASSAGAAYVFRRTGVTWAQEAFLKAPNANVDDMFGEAVAMSGDTIVVGAYGEDSSQLTTTNGITASSNNSATYAGAAYVFTVNRQATWQQQAYVKAPNAEVNDKFGHAVAIDRDTLVVGAFGEDSAQTTITNGTTASSDNASPDSGAVYVFKHSGTSWVQQAYLKAPNPNSFDIFGAVVAAYGDTIAVGAVGEDSNQTTITNGTTGSFDNSRLDSGAVYIFRRTGVNWAQEAYIKAPNTTSQFNLKLGGAIAVHDDTVLVGAFGDDSNQTTITNGSTASTNNSAINSGAAYVFKRGGTTWAQEAYLKAPNAEANDNFGASVAIHGDTAVVSAPEESSNQTTITNGATASADNSAVGSGAVYVFKRTAGTNWAPEAYLKPPNVGGGDSFGNSVSIDGDTIVVGSSSESSNQTTITNGATASSDNSASESGAVYVFKRTGAIWVQEAYLKAPNAGAGDRFGSYYGPLNFSMPVGSGVAISGDTIVVGAPQEDSNQTTITNGSGASSDNSASEAGAAYVFKRTGSLWNIEAYLKAPNAEAGDEFGTAVGVSGDTIVVGAPKEDGNQTTITNGSGASSDNSASEAGAVYIFKR